MLPDEGGSTRRARPYTAQHPHLRGQQPARSAVRRPGPQPEGAIRGRMARMRAGQEESLDRDGRQWNCSSYPDPEEEDRAAPQGPSLRDT